MGTGAAQYFFHSAPIVLGDVVMVGADSATGGGVHAFDRLSGRQRWMQQAVGSGVFGAISATGELAYAIDAERVLAIDVASGALRWSFPFQQGGGWLTPAVARGRVFVGGRDGVVYALNADTGRVEWRANLGIPIRASVILAAGGLYVGTNDGSVFRLDPADGAIRASHRLDTALGSRFLAAMDGSLLVLMADVAEAYLALVSIDLELGGVRWRQSANTRWSTSRVFVTNQMALFGSPEGDVTGYCVADGSKAWSHGVKGTVRAISGSADVLYVGTMEGSLYALAPAPSCRVE